MTAARVRFGYEDESGSDWELDAASLGVAAITLHNDRGAAFDATRVDVGETTIVPESEQLLDQAIPATYGRATVDLAPGTYPYTFSFQLTSSGETYILRSTESLSFEARCDLPATSTPSDVLEMDLVVSLDGLVAILEGAGLPPTMGTPLVLDDDTAPALIASVATWLESAWTAECGTEEEDGGV